MNLSLFDSKSQSHQLTIVDVSWGDDGYSLVFFTDNPLGLGPDSAMFKKMPLTSRLLTATEGVFQLQMTETGIQRIFPESEHLGSLSLKASVDSP